MQVDELRELKKKLENDIMDLVEKFNAECPLGVKSVWLDTSDFSIEDGFVKLSKPRINGVKVELEAV